jgi:hypothetical protein
VYAYRARGVQRWKTVDTYSDARRGKLAAQVDADRGELRDLSRVAFGDYAREWVANYQGRTSNGFRESTRSAYTQMLEARIIPYFDGRARFRLAEIEPRDVKAQQPVGVVVPLGLTAPQRQRRRAVGMRHEVGVDAGRGLVGLVAAGVAAGSRSKPAGGR